MLELPFLGHLVVRGAEAEVPRGVRAGLFPGGEVRMGAARYERHARALVRHGGGGTDADHQSGRDRKPKRLSNH